MANPWTEAQQNAIEARDGTVLVSAAAGSGKTAVLVERAIRRMTDPESPMDVSRLLVVTFTRAAAAEMKSRIAQRLSDMLLEHPEDARLQRQLILLPSARISTMDSFCTQLVRENFQQLGISPKFKISSGKELELLKMEVAEEILEEQYKKNETGSAFSRLTDLVTGGKNDEQLTDILLTTVTFIQSHPFPDVWLRQKQDMFVCGGDPARSVWGQALFRHAEEVVRHCLDVNAYAQRLLLADGEFCEKYAPVFAADRSSLEAMESTVATEKWDALYRAVHAYEPVRMNGVRGRTEEPLALRIKGIRETVKTQIKSLKVLFSGNSEAFRADIKEHGALSQALFDAARAFMARYTERKREKGVLDFSDLTHYTIRLLVSKETEQRTELARELSESFDEIMIDEYQDTNEAQDMIFRALSRDERNLFMVGDVKQSIYGFRSAMPELFLGRCKRYPDYDREEKKHPAKIILDKNFRSRSGVTGVINYIFRQIMTEESGGLAYSGKEELKPAAQYPQSRETCAELHILDTGDYEGEDARRTLDARHIGQIIGRMMAEKTTVTVGGTTRPMQYRDVCILLRKAKTSAEQIAEQYVKELERQGIPAWAEETGGFFETTEVATVLSLLQVIDNPNQDIPLLAVMMSPIYGFTGEEVAQLRGDHPHGRVYYAVRAAEEDSAHVRGFLAELSRFRALSATLPADQLIARLYDRTGYTAIVQAMKNGGLRLSNLRLMLEYARDYEQSGGQGLSGFVRFLSRMAEHKLELAQASSLSEAADVVRVMTIHKSKGLEFPVCILADSVDKLRVSTGQRNILLHAKLGLGAKQQALEGLVNFKTLPYEAVNLLLDREQMAEALRVMYVAMTRAREKLIVTAAMKQPLKRLSTLAQEITGQELSPFSIRRKDSMADWVMICAFRHPSGRALRAALGIGEEIVLPSDEPWRIEIHPAQEAGAEETALRCLQTPSQAHKEEIERILSYTYPEQARVRIPAKVTASALAGEGEERWSKIARPNFERQKTLTAAEKGIAVHKYMQFARYAQAAANPDEERRRLVEKKFLTPEEGAAVDMESVRAFFASALGRRVLSAKCYHPEVRFMVGVRADEVVSDISPDFSDQPVILNGVVDCVLEEEDGLVIIDYKTDRADGMDILAERYKKQLLLYAEAMRACFEKPVKECVIYSFYLGKSGTL